jgi:steroid delta-isomerase
MSTEAILKVVAEYFAATRALDVEAVVATFAENAVSHDPVGGPAIEGHDGLRQFFQGMTEAFETGGLTEDHVFVAGNGAAVKWTGHGVGKNGREVTFEGIDVFEVNEEGTIQTLWGYWDPVAMMAQLQG